MNSRLACRAALAALAAGLCYCPRLTAQPLNDTCAGAESLACNSTVVVDNTLASTDASDPIFSCHYGEPDQGVGTVWFTFVASDTSALVQTCSSVVVDTELAVYSGTCGSLVELACSEDACGFFPGFLSRVCVEGLNVGETYYVQVASFDNDSRGEITVDLICPCPGPPANETCATAQSIPCNGTVFVDNSSSTTDLDDPVFSCHDFGPTQGLGTVWYSFVASDTSAVLSTCQSGVADTLLAVYDGSCGNLVEIACGNNECGPGFSQLSRACATGLTIGQTYYVQVASFSEDSLGLIRLDIQCPCPTVENDHCVNAQPLDCDSVTVVDNTFATVELDDPIPSCHYLAGPGSGTVWYRFVATADSAQVKTCNSEVFDTVVAIYDGVCGSLVEIGCSEDGCELRSDACATNLMIGNTYYVKIASFDMFNLGEITVELNCPCPKKCITCPADANTDLLIDGLDVQFFADCYLNGGEGLECGCSDLNRDGGVDDDDLPLFVALLLDETGACDGLCEPGAQGQLPNLFDALASDGVEFQTADNLTALEAGAIARVRWWGTHLPEGECPDVPNAFSITYFADNNGRPGAIKAGPISVAATSEETGQLIAGFAPVFVYAADHEPVPVEAGECLWMSIVNPDSENCEWFWATSDEGDGIAAQTRQAPAWGIHSRIEIDMAWCVDVELAEEGCPLPVGACCEEGVCTGTTTRDECLGAWHPDEDCDSFSCPVDSGNCCDANVVPGCQDAACQFCACESDSFCCDVVWDGLCVSIARNECAPPCNCPVTGACCDGASCTDTTQEQCAFEFYPFQLCGSFSCPAGVMGACCADGVCTNTTQDQCLTDFFPFETCESFTCPHDSGDCCGDHEEPGCEDPVCEACVCSFDEFCCDSNWDDVCARRSFNDCAESCGCQPVDTCCVSTTLNPGCLDFTCEFCVCGFDPFCCITVWDLVCELRAEGDCSGVCACNN